MKSLIELAVKYKIWSNVLIILTFGLGIKSCNEIKRTSFPIEPSKNISVQVTYPGAAPEEIEEGIVLKVEESLQGIEGVKEVTSTSQENFASVNVEIIKGYDIDELVTEVKNSVDRISAFPDGAEKPIVFKQKVADQAGIMILEGNVPVLQLKKYADQIEDELLQSDLISQVSILNVPEIELSIEIPELVLRRYGFTFDDIANAVRRNNTNIAAGTIKSTDEEVLIRANAKKYDPAQYESIILTSKADGSKIRLGDIATIKEQFEDKPDRTIFNGGNAIAIQVAKLAEEDLLAIVEELKVYIEDFNNKHEEVSLVLSIDTSKTLLQRLDLLLENGGVGLLLVLITLGLFLSLRLSFWVAFGIPFSFCGGS